MAAIPAKCDRCNFVFGSGINAVGVRNLELNDCTSSCPKCGGMAKLIDGTFDVGEHANGPFTQTGGRPVDPSLFAHIGLLLIEGQQSRESPARVIQRIEPHAPGIAQRLRAVAHDPNAFATVLASIIAGLAAIAAAAIASGGSNVSPANIEINVHTDGGFDRERESLNRLRSYEGQMPSWASDYLEPKKT